MNRKLALVVALLAGIASAKTKPAKPKTPPPAAAAAAPATEAAAPAAAENPADILTKVDAILSPPEFEAKLTFVSHKSQGEVHTYSLRLLKKDSDKFRIWFLSPPDDVGQEVLRISNDMWSYMPNLKRALKVSTKQDFQGGDFANSDVLRVELMRDYTPVIKESTAEQWVLELTAKNDEVTYARVLLVVRKKDNQPIQFEYFTGSGKLVRKMELADLKAYGKLVRPTKWVMHNMLEPKRRSEMTYDTFNLRKDLDSAVFEQAALGR